MHTFHHEKQSETCNSNFSPLNQKRDKADLIIIKPKNTQIS